MNENFGLALGGPGAKWQVDSGCEFFGADIIFFLGKIQVDASRKGAMRLYQEGGKQKYGRGWFFCGVVGGWVGWGVGWREGGL